MENNIIVIQDTREQYPWDFSFFGYTQAHKCLKTGDYTLAGFEDKLSIERKKSTGELALNIGSKSKAFYAELERMRKFEYRYLILEFSEEALKEFPNNSGIPKKAQAKLRISANYLMSCVEKIRSQYDVEVIFAGSRDNAINHVINIFNEIIKNNGQRRAIF